MAKLNLADQVSGRTGTKDTKSKEWGINLIPLGDIKWVSNVRSDTQSANIDSLVSSIREVGLKQPIAVYLENDEYCLLFGHRRFLAYQQLYKETPEKFNVIPCVISDGKDTFITQLIENMQREGLNDKDLVAALKQLKDQGLSNEKIAGIMGKKTHYVDNIFAAINETKEHPELESFLSTPAGGSLQAIAETAGIADIPERTKLIEQKLNGTITRKDLREKKKSLKEAQAPVVEGTPAGGSSLPLEIALTVNEADFKIELVLQNKDIALLQKLNKKLQSFLKREKVVLSTTPAGGSSEV